MKFFTVSQAATPVPQSVLLLPYHEIGIAVKAINIAINSGTPKTTAKIIKEINQWCGLEEEKIADILVRAFNLKQAGFVDTAVIGTPIIKTVNKTIVTNDSSIGNPDFLAQCREDYPDLNIEEQAKEYIKIMRGLKYVISQKGFRNFLQKIHQENKLLSTTKRQACFLCNGTRTVTEFQAGEEVEVDCPACSE